MSDDPTHDQPTGFDADRDPVEVALAAAGATPVTIDPERLAALEARVMGAVTDLDDRGAVVALGSAPARGVRRRSRGRSMWSAAAVVLVVALGALTVVLLAGDDDALAIADADRVVVELPDGESVAGEAGTELPDGARLEVIGFVEIDGRRFGPGSYRIVDGDVVRSKPDEPSDTSDGTAEGGSDSSRPAPADGDGADGDGAEGEGAEGEGVDRDGSVRTTVVGGARSGDEAEERAPDDDRDGTFDDSTVGDDADRTVVPRRTDSPRTTAPQQTPDVTRPPAPTTLPVRPATTARNNTTTSTATSTTTTSTTTTTTSTTTTTTTGPARANVAEADGDSRPGTP